MNVQQKSLLTSVFNIFFSFKMCSIYLVPEISFFCKHFMAKTCLDELTSLTVPKLPCPRTLISLRSLNSGIIFCCYTYCLFAIVFLVFVVYPSRELRFEFIFDVEFCLLVKNESWLSLYIWLFLELTTHSILKSSFFLMLS